MARAGVPAGRRELRDLVKSYLDTIGRQVEEFTNNRPSIDFVRRFERRNKHILTRRKPELLTTARVKALTAANIDAFFKIWSDTLKDNGLEDQPGRIFNCDETGFNLDPVPKGHNKVYTEKGAKDTFIHNATCGKQMNTVLFCCSASGNFLPGLVIYKAKTMSPTWTMHGPVNMHYSVSESGKDYIAYFSLIELG